MKIIILFIFSFVVVLVSCSEKAAQAPAENNQTNDNEETTQKKRTSRPSSGPLAPINLGEFSYSIGDISKNVTQFKSGYNDLTITKENVTIRLTDMNGASFLIVLEGVESASEWRNDYGAILSDKKEGPRGLITYVSGDHSYQWKSGTFVVEELDPKSGKFKARLTSSKAVNARNILSEERLDFELEIEVRFENIVNLLNSPF
jgi:hypothetical protein